MLRRPQRTEDRLRAGGEDGAYLCGSLEGWGELKQVPRAQPSGSRFGWSASTGRTAAVVFAAASQRERYAAARGVRVRTGVVHSPATPLAAAGCRMGATARGGKIAFDLPRSGRQGRKSWRV